MLIALALYHVFYNLLGERRGRHFPVLLFRPKDLEDFKAFLAIIG